MKASEVKVGDLVRILFTENEYAFSALCCDKPYAEEVVWVNKPDDQDYLIGCYLGPYQVGKKIFTRHLLMIPINDIPMTFAVNVNLSGILEFSNCYIRIEKLDVPS